MKNWLVFAGTRGGLQVRGFWSFWSQHATEGEARESVRKIPASRPNYVWWHIVDLENESIVAQGKFGVGE